MDSLPTPPNEEHQKPSMMSRKSSGSSKAVKQIHRASKRASNPHVHAHPPSPVSDTHSHHTVADGRHKRVWKACERCRMKKTKVIIYHFLFHDFVVDSQHALTRHSAMESSRVSVVRTTVSCVQPGQGKRPNTSNYHEGTLRETCEYK